MPSSRRPVRRVVSRERETRWPLVGGVVAMGLVALGVLLFLSARGPTLTNLEDYCDANTERCFFQGVEDAAVTMVEVSDYGCAHCRNYYRETEPLVFENYVNQGLIRYIVIPFALREETAFAAGAALCAAEQGAFDAMHHRLFELQGNPAGFSRTALQDVAVRIGLDEAMFAQCIEEDRYLTTIEQNVAAASQSGVRLTPSFFVNGQKLEGAQPFTYFQQHLDNLLN